MSNPKPLHPLEVLELQNIDRRLRVWLHLLKLTESPPQDAGQVISIRRPTSA